MSLTRAQLQARLDAYLIAETKILSSQEYSVGDGSTARRRRRADLAEVRAAIADLQRQINAIDSAAGTGGRRVYYARPHN